MTIQTSIISETKRGAFLYRRENWEMADNPPAIEIDAVYNLDGDYVGEPSFADGLAELGIVPQKRTPTSNVCSVGFSAEHGKWYGWSHRAMCGFGVGDVVAVGDVCADDLPIGFKAETLDDAKRMADAFAAAVS